MGVGSGSGADNVVPVAGRIRWFTATDDSLTSWTDASTQAIRQLLVSSTSFLTDCL